MNRLLFFNILLSTIIGSIYARNIKFKIIAFGHQVSVYINGNAYIMRARDDYSRVHMITVPDCPDGEFE